MNLQNNNRIHYMTVISSQVEAQQVKLLIEILRRFGGRLGENPIWLFLTDMNFASDFSGLGDISVLPLNMDSAFRSYSLSEKVFACAQAEELAGTDVQSLIWLNPDCLIFNRPELFVLDDDHDAAFRPVHICNVGSLASEPLDGYWQGVYQVMGVEHVPYTLESFVDGQTIRPYFNTHCFAINPAKGILQAWRSYFLTLILDEEFQDAYCHDALHQIFLHQVVLSALVMKSIDQARILMLPPDYSYPLHLQDKLPAARRNQYFNKLVCMVYEDSTLLEGIEINEPIFSWLKAIRPDPK